MICNSCETKNTQDAKFCKTCGKSLKEGENKNNFMKLLTDTKDVIIGMFKKPIDTMKNFIKEENYINGIIYIVINAVLFSLIMLVLSSALYEAFMYMFNSSAAYLSAFTTQIEIPYVKIFFISMIFYLLYYVVYGGTTYLMSRYAFKSDTKLKNIISWLGVNLILLSVIFIVVIICLLINLKFGIIVLSLGSILNTYYLYKSIGDATNTDENKLGYVVLTSVFVTMFIIGFILPKLFA